MKFSPSNTIKAQLEKYKPIEVPYHVWRLFGEKSKLIYLAGDQVSLGEDYSSLSETREAIEWYVSQLGGTVKWSK